MAQSSSSSGSMPRVKAEGGRPSQDGDNDGCTTSEIATVHRRACLRRRAVAVSWSEMEAEYQRDDYSGAPADNNDESNAADGSIGSTSRRQVSLTELRRELLHDATYVRSDGTVMPPVVVTRASNGNGNDDGGCGSTDSSYSYDCQLLIMEQQPPNDERARSDSQPHRQEAAVARHVGDALVRDLKSRPLGGIGSSRHGIASARSTGRAVMEDNNRPTPAPSETTNNTATDATATMSTPRKIIGSIGSMAWGLAQIVSPVLTTSNVGHYDGMEDEDISNHGSGDEGEDEDADNGRRLFLDNDRDAICHVGLMVDCIRLILSHAATTEMDGHDAKLLYRFEKGPQSLAEFCRLAASASLSAMGERTAEHTALCETLSELSSADLELLLLAMVSAEHAMLSADGDVVALLPKHSAGSNVESIVGKVSVAIFRLQTTVAALELRIEHLSEQADTAQARGVSAKKKRQSNLAVTYLKLRNLRRAEIDRASASLLNVEQSLQMLQRTRADAEVVKAYKLAGDAMKMARKSEEEGGLGLNAKNVGEMTDELAEVTEEINETSAMLEKAGLDNGIGQFDEEELLQELDALEDVDDLADALASTGIKDEGNTVGKGEAETKAEKVDGKIIVEKEVSGETEEEGPQTKEVAMVAA